MTTNPLAQLADAELALLKQPLIALGQALQQPGANLLTAQNAIANLLLTVPQLSGPAQGAAFNIAGSSLVAFANSIGATTTTN